MIEIPRGDSTVPRADGNTEVTHPDGLVPDDTVPPPPRMVTVLFKYVLPFAVVLVGGAIAGVLIVLAPSADSGNPPPRVELVEVIEALPTAVVASVHATGTVHPARQLTVIPEVGGRIVDQHRSLVPGGRFDQGEVMARIDSRDYRLAVDQEASRVRQAELELALEEGRQATAEREWALLGDGRADADLALRRPHRATAQHSLEAARAAHRRAELALERTALRAPFPAIVLTESVDVGQVVGPGGGVATLAGTERFRVEVSVPVDKLALVDIPGTGDATSGSEAIIRAHLADGAVVERRGTVVRLGGRLDEATRTAKLLVEVSDPLDPPDGGLPLMIGAFVDVEVLGRTLADTVPLPRTALYDGGRVWVVDTDDTLAPRDVEVALRDADRVVVRAGLQAGERVITTPLALPIPGTPVRIRTPDPQSADRGGDAGGRL